MAASSGDWFSARSAAAARVWPGWQYPHWTTLPQCHASRIASMTGPEAPSTVVTALPTAVPAGVWHDLVFRPSISTVHAAHCPIPQPYFGPCSSSTSRSTHSSGLPAKRSSTSTSALFTFSFMTTSWIGRRARAAASLSGLALVDPLLKRCHLAGGPRAVARHLPAAQGADDGVGVL